MAEALAALLLTGGASRRMGRNKALLRVEGVPNARRLAGVLRAVSEVVLEVGPGCSGLPHVVEEPAGAGPLVAFAGGASVLAERGWAGPILLLACDLPLIDVATLSVIALHPGRCSVVPCIGGRPQPLAARWSVADAAYAGEAVRAGERSMMALVDRPQVHFVDESAWPAGAAARAFADMDTPADVERLGLAWHAL